MADDKNKNTDKERELEIESILQETHYLADQEKMEKTAKKYRAKPKMDEIFSNTDKKPRLKNDNPLDVDMLEGELVYDDSNTIVGEKTATTMQVALAMDGNDDEVLTPEQAKLAAEKKAEQKRLEEEKKLALEQEENKFVTLTPEYDENAEVAGEIIGEVEQFKEEKNFIQNVDSIDIDISGKEYEKIEQELEIEKKKEESRYEELFGIKTDSRGNPAQKVVSTVPVYISDEKAKTLNVKAGKFSDVLEREYEEYIKSKNPSVMAHVIRQELKKEEEPEKKPKDNRSPQEKVLSAVVGFFSKDESDDSDTIEEKAKTVEDYTGEDDEKSIFFELNSNIKRLFGRCVLTAVIAIVSIILSVVTRIFPQAICSVISFAPAAYAVINFILVAFSIFINRVSVINGLAPLVRFKGNSDTAAAVASITAVIQTLVSFFCLGDLSAFNINYYCVVVLIAFFANNLGKLFMVLRVKDNFRFVSAKAPKYAGKIYNNESVANRMMSGTASDKNLIAYQHKTDFASNYLKISYAPDPSEDLSSKLAPITTITAILISVMYGFAQATFAGAVNVFALITAVSVPVATLVSVNFPMRRLCKTLLSFGAMLSGYPSVKQFCDTTALMLDSTELFPADTITLDGIKTFEDYNIDESLLCGIAILKEGGNPIANAFDAVVAETGESLPEVESVLYEDEMGLVGWINSERILVGSRRLMEKYNVEAPNLEYENNYTSKNKQITYLSRAGRLVAMFVTSYAADSELKQELQRAEANGISFIIRTTDFNITNDLIAKEYNLFYRSVKVLPTGLGNVLKEAEDTVEETSRAYLITGGKPSSLARAVSGSVRIKHNISLAIIIQLIAVIIGVLVAATLSLYAGVGVMGTLEILIYSMFWGIAAIVAPALQKP